MKILAISSVFPNRLQPLRGLHICELLFQQSQLNDLIVINPISIVPPFDVFKKALTKPAILWQWFEEKRQIPSRDKIADMNIYHPYIICAPKKLLKCRLGITMFFRLIPLVNKLNKQFTFDVIHAHNSFPEGFAATLLGKLYKIPTVITHRLTEESLNTTQSKTRDKIKYLLLKLVNLNIIESITLNKKLNCQYGSTASKYCFTSFGVNTKKYFPQDKLVIRQRLHLPLDKKIVIYKGDLSSDNGLNYLIDAVEIFSTKKKKILLYILGDGDLRQALMRKIKKLSLESLILIKCDIAPGDDPLWTSVADLLVLPTLTDHDPTPILQALACGTPVVASQTEATTEIMNNNKLGFVVNPRDCKDFADKIIRALQITWNKEDLVNHAYKYDIEKVTNKIQKCYEGLK